MAKRKLPKVKVSKDTGNTVIKVAGLGLVAFFAYKMFANSNTTNGLLGGGYSGSGTDLSGILPFLQETPPTFNISNPEIPSSFFINPSDVLTTTSTTGETVTEIGTKKEFTVARLPNETVVGNTSTSLSTNLFNPNYWFGNIGKDLSNEEYNLRSDNYSQYALFKTPTEFINAGVNPLGFIYNKIFNKSSSSGSGGGGGGSKIDCPSCQGAIGVDKWLGRDTNDSYFTVNLDTKKDITVLNTLKNNTGNTAKEYLSSLRTNKNTLGIWSENPTLNRIGTTAKGETEYLITNSQNLGKYWDYSKKQYVTDLSQVERAIQNDFAKKLASGNCGSAISTNACSGTKKQTNYANTNSSGTRYYENTGTSLTRSDLVVNF